MNTRRNRRVRTGMIRARAIDNRLAYTTHLLIRQTANGPHEYASLDVDRTSVSVHW